MHVCVCVRDCFLLTLSLLLSSGGGERFRDIRKASEKRHAKIPLRPKSDKTPTLLHTQSQALSQKRIIICSAARELSPHIQLFTSHFTLPFENRRGRGGVAWLFIYLFIYLFICGMK